MQGTILRLYVKLQNLTNSEQGQDLVEYALLCSLIALALIASISTLAHAVNNAFTNVSSSLA
jgi:Flp pilus assembly pilin Flp